MQRIIQDISEGNESAFKELFESFFIPLCNYAKSFSFIRDDMAKDISQETLIKYWHRKEYFNNFNQVRAFLYKTVRNACLNELDHIKVVDRSQPFIKESLIVDSVEIDTIIEEEVFRQLKGAIEELPKRSRAIIRMTLSKMTNDQIALELGISRETVRSLKKIAHKKLRLKINRE